MVCYPPLICTSSARYFYILVCMPVQDLTEILAQDEIIISLKHLTLFECLIDCSTSYHGNLLALILFFNVDSVLQSWEMFSCMKWSNASIICSHLIKYVVSSSFEQLLLQKVGSSSYPLKGTARHLARSMPSQWTLPIPQDRTEPTLGSWGNY